MKIIEFSGCKLAIRTDAINAIDIDPDDKKTVRIFFGGIGSPGGYKLHHPSEELAMEVFNTIVKEMKA
jgi:hypothetical protein